MKHKRIIKNYLRKYHLFLFKILNKKKNHYNKDFLINADFPMLYRQRLKIAIVFFIILFPILSFASVKKTNFILTILPEIEKAKDEIGGDAKKIPNSLVLVQAILESGRGTSYKARNGNNYFGIKRGKNYARFDHYREGIKYYVTTLMTHGAYKDLRKHLGSDSLTLINYLGQYAKDPKYKEKLAEIIRSDDLMSFDS